MSGIKRALISSGAWGVSRHHRFWPAQFRLYDDMKPSLKISIAHGDALEFDADVLVLKHAQRLYGLDQAAFGRLEGIGIKLSLPKPTRFAFQDSLGSMKPRRLLFVGVKSLQQFGYPEIRDFAVKALAFLAREAPKTRSIALTIHGTGYGLDESEAFESELAGLVEAISNRSFPRTLECITFVESNTGRADRLTQSLKRLLPEGVVPIDDSGSIAGLEDQTRDTLRTAGNASLSKSHVFVAMPFASEMDDVFHYRIQGAVNAAGLLCERADLSTFTGDVVSWVKQRISTATLVIADLSSANPNVYLEVGYAWGCQVPTVLLARDANDLKFDAKGQRCLLYKSIKNLEETLRVELQGILKKQ
jgi:hypothetical protein